MSDEPARLLHEDPVIHRRRWFLLGVMCLSLVMVVMSLAFETRQFTLTGELVFAMAWLVLVLSIGAIALLMVMIRDGEVSKVASLFYLVPAVTALIAWALFGEELTPVQIGGMALATFGVALATQRSPASSNAA